MASLGSSDGKHWTGTIRKAPPNAQGLVDAVHQREELTPEAGTGRRNRRGSARFAKRGLGLGLDVRNRLGFALSCCSIKSRMPRFRNRLTDQPSFAEPGG